MIKIRKFEAFKAGYAAIAVQKIANILGRRIGETFTVVEVPIEYENSYGSFAGYIVAMESEDKQLRFNFSLGKSDKIVSVDIYNSISYTPDYTIDTEGYNIVQVLNTVADVIQGKPIEESIKEKGRRPFAMEGFLNWVNSNKREVEDILQNERLSKAYDFFADWTIRNNIPSLSQSAFIRTAKSYLEAQGLKNKYARKGTVKKGSREKAITTDKIKADEFDTIPKLSGGEQFEMLAQYVRLISEEIVNSLYVYGPPGTGKTKNVIAELKKVGATDYKHYSGGVKGVQDLVRLLYEHRDKEILVFDDFDSVLKSKEMKNIMKAALQDEYSRTISYIAEARVKKYAIPESFEFTSGVIFITNIARVDPAIKSRSMVVNIDLSKGEILERIKSVLETFMPKVPIEIKMEVYRFLKRTKEKVKRIDFRQFKFVVVNRLAHPTKWRRWSLAMLTA